MRQLFRAGADDALALGAPGEPPLGCCQLRAFVADTVRALNERGIGRNGRVALVMELGLV